MKKNLNVFLLALLLAFASCSFTTKKTSNDDKDKILLQFVTFALENGHYSPLAFNDDYSAKLYTNFLETIDPLKRYFYESDIKEFEKYKFQLDDEIKALDLTFFNLVYGRLIQRIDESKEIYKKVLEHPFDFNVDENISTEYKDLTFVNTKEAMIKRWEKQLKLTAISNYEDNLETEKKAKEKDPKYVVKTNAELEQKARETTLRSYDVYFNDNVKDFNRDDWFSIYINSIVEVFDPHTYYLAPDRKQNFDQNMSGQLEGIGAQLQKSNDYIKVVKLISGGPAWRGRELEAEDLILKVKQENEAEPIDIVNMRLTDAIKYIKGPKGTKVTLTVKKVDGTIKDIVITRDIIELEETYAKSAVVKKDNHTYGIIDLPSFYVDFKDYKSINAAKDVKQEIERLKQEGVEGLVLDLRNNGGGSLSAVVDLAGLFIKDGPVVQVRSRDNSKRVLEDTDSSISWDGPLVILVNELSASASEIMAAAMQDYKRAIIIGGKQTFGKGTVQNVINLNTIKSTDYDLGALALTSQKYYRINGGSVQLEGVKSDIQLPDKLAYVDVGEKDKDNALPWDEISPAKYKIWDSFDYDTAVAKSEARMKQKPQFKLIDDNALWIKSQMNEKEVPLQYEKYKAKIDINEKESKQFDSISKYDSKLTFNSTGFETSLLEKDTTDLKEKRKRWHEDLSHDIYLEEALNVLEDLETLPINNKVGLKK